jgi:hypothetical protein
MTAKTHQNYRRRPRDISASGPGVASAAPTLLDPRSDDVLRQPVEEKISTLPCGCKIIARYRGSYLMGLEIRGKDTHPSRSVGDTSD